MIEAQTSETLINNYTVMLLDYVTGKFPSGPRTFGFEYEFLPETPLDLNIMENLYAFMPQCGFLRERGSFRSASGMRVTFEPGGQIEYNSMPLLAQDTGSLEQSLEIITDTNLAIEKALGIKYIPTGYIPGREDSPLCLDEERYIFLHDRMLTSGTRGREMMKGSASIHLHVVIRNLEEFVPVFLKLFLMSKTEDFKMGKERRNIWDNTDPCRCGMPYEGINIHSVPHDLMYKLVSVAVHADILGENVPFFKAKDSSFSSFLNHFTTIFTDIRLNNKGPTWELRTCDSIPFTEFRLLWKRFVRTLSQTDEQE